MKKYISLLIVPFLFGFVLHCNKLKPKRIECFYVDSFMKKERNAIIEEGDTTAYKTYLVSVVKNKHIPRSNSFFYSLWRYAIIIPLPIMMLIVQLWQYILTQTKWMKRQNDFVSFS